VLLRHINCVAGSSLNLLGTRCHAENEIGAEEMDVEDQERKFDEMGTDMSRCTLKHVTCVDRRSLGSVGDGRRRVNETSG
jgi:hypothetical protein